MSWQIRDRIRPQRHLVPVAILDADAAGEALPQQASAHLEAAAAETVVFISERRKGWGKQHGDVWGIINWYFCWYIGVISDIS